MDFFPCLKFTESFSHVSFGIWSQIKMCKEAIFVNYKKTMFYYNVMVINDFEPQAVCTTLHILY